MATTSTSPGRHCSTATWIIRLSPGQHSTVTAVPPIRAPGQAGRNSGPEVADPAERLVHGGDAEAAERLGVPGVGARRVGDDDGSHAGPPGCWVDSDSAAMTLRKWVTAAASARSGSRSAIASHEVGQLAEADPRAPGPQRQPELVADQLRLQPADQVRRDGLAGGVARPCRAAAG